jgi:hypothetical protein
VLGYFDASLLLSHGVVLQLDAHVLHDLLPEGKIDLDVTATSNCLDDQERRGRLSLK